MKPLKFSDTQVKISQHPGHALVLGAAGVGKTTALLARAAALVDKGVPAAEIAVLCFSYRSMKLVEEIAAKRYGAKLAGVTFATLRDFAGAAQPEGKTVATNNQVRDMIKRAMVEENFKGGVSEAEHVIRTFKGRSRKPQDNEPHFGLLQTYKKLMDSENWVDRHDLTRAHIIGLRKGELPPAPVKHMLVDNVQDATQIQLVWLTEHVGQGVTLCATVNDDVTIFGRDGALGLEAVSLLEEMEELTTFKLEQNFRTPKSLHAAITKPARQLKQRLQKQDAAQQTGAGTLRKEVLADEAAEHAFLVAEVQAALQKNAGARVGLVVRHDYLANRLLHAFHKAGLRPASYGRPIWEKPGAGTVLAMLYLVLGQSSGPRFERFLLIHLGARVGGVLAEAGLSAEQFLRDKDLPSGVELPADHVRAYHSLRRRVNGYMRLLQSGQADARDVFKATVADTLPKLTAEEQEDALLAAQILLSLQGRLAELLPRLEQETLPNMQSQVIIAPVRETRNMEFDALFLPYQQAGVWPPAARALPQDLEHERRLFVQALSRSKGNVTITRHGEAGVFFGEVG